jgi:hypothetical protein
MLLVCGRTENIREKGSFRMEVTIFVGSAGRSAATVVRMRERERVQRLEKAEFSVVANGPVQRFYDRLGSRRAEKIRCVNGRGMCHMCSLSGCTSLWRECAQVSLNQVLCGDPRTPSQAGSQEKRAVAVRISHAKRLLKNETREKACVLRRPVLC